MLERGLYSYIEIEEKRNDLLNVRLHDHLFARHFCMDHPCDLFGRAQSSEHPEHSVVNKGETIRSLIGVGLSNEAILLRVPTTLNSIRWHRSKLQQFHGSTSLTKPQPRKAVPSLTVGEALEQHGLADEVRDCLERLDVNQFSFSNLRAQLIYDELAAWKFVLNGRVTSRFGQCCYTRRTIEVHEKLLDLPKDFRITFLHECAHALDKMIHGRSSGHGFEWKQIMSVGFLLPPMRCGHKTGEASEALKSIKMEKAFEVWECSNCGDEIPIARKRKYPAHSYTHRKCGGHFQVKSIGAN